MWLCCFAKSIETWNSGFDEQVFSKVKEQCSQIVNITVVFTIHIPYFLIQMKVFFILTKEIILSWSSCVIIMLPCHMQNISCFIMNAYYKYTLLVYV